jgi:hypothetical protein
MHFVQKLDEIFCSHQLGPFHLRRFLCGFFVWMTYLLVIREVLMSPATTVLESIYAFGSFRVCLM